MENRQKNSLGNRRFFSLVFRREVLLCALLGGLAACAQADIPGARNVVIPTPVGAEGRKEAVNERPDPVLYLPLGYDVLVPEAMDMSPLPEDLVGPYELRSETLAGALQLILDDYNIPIAFETDEGLTRTVTITNLSGHLSDVVDRVCGLADLYCAFDDGILVVKETQIFSVTVPPVDDSDTLLSDVASAIAEITESTPIKDNSTRTIVYRASHRTERIAKRYFQKLRSNTALIIFETYIWEVSLDSGNTTGINWSKIDTLTGGKFEFGVAVPGGTDPELGTPVSIGLPTTNGMVLDASDVLRFISEYGAVKTISQPQITVRSGADARLRVADTQNYVASITRSSDEGVETVSTTTDSVDTGFTLEISSDWDNATVYGTINILLQEVKSIETFDENPDAIVQLPETTERELETQLRVRPGDSLLIAGLVREIDNYTSSGPGAHSPIIPTSRSARASNIELVIMMRPRVVVYTSPGDVRVPQKVKTSLVTPAVETVPVVPVKPPVFEDPLAVSEKPRKAPPEKAVKKKPAKKKPAVPPVTEKAVVPVVKKEEDQDSDEPPVLALDNKPDDLLKVPVESFEEPPEEPLPEEPLPEKPLEESVDHSQSQVVPSPVISEGAHDAVEDVSSDNVQALLEKASLPLVEETESPVSSESLLEVDEDAFDAQPQVKKVDGEDNSAQVQDVTTLSSEALLSSPSQSKEPVELSAKELVANFDESEQPGWEPGRLPGSVYMIMGDEAVPVLDIEEGQRDMDSDTGFLKKDDFGENE